MARQGLPTLAPIDSSTLDLTVTGDGSRQAPWRFSGDIVLSADAGQFLELRPDGLFGQGVSLGVIDDGKVDLTLSGAGTAADPYVISSEVRPGSIAGTELADGAVDVAKLANTVGLNDLDGSRIDGPIDANNQTIGNLPIPVTGDQAATKAYVDLVVAAVPTPVTTVVDTATVDLSLIGTVLSGAIVAGSVGVPQLDPSLSLTDFDGAKLVNPVDMGGQLLVNLADPVLPQDAATRAYVDRNRWFRAPSNTSWTAARDTHVVVGSNVTITLPADGGGFWMVEDPTATWASGATPDVIAPPGTTIGYLDVTLLSDGGGPIMWVLIGTEWYPIQNASGGTVTGGFAADEFGNVTALDPGNAAGLDQVYLTQTDGLNPIGEYTWDGGMWIQTG